MAKYQIPANSQSQQKITKQSLFLRKGDLSSEELEQRIIESRKPTPFQQREAISPFQGLLNIGGGLRQAAGETPRALLEGAALWHEEAVKPTTGAASFLFSPSVREQYRRAREQGQGVREALGTGWEEGLTDTPWGLKGAAELLLDPLNLMPVVGFPGAIARGAGAGARLGGRAVAPIGRGIAEGVAQMPVPSALRPQQAYIMPPEGTAGAGMGARRTEEIGKQAEQARQATDARMTFGMGTPASRLADAADPSVARLDTFLTKGVVSISTESKATIKAIQKSQNKPNARVRIYRAVPEGVTSIDPGDWVALDRAYASMHLRNPSDKIISQIVDAKDVAWARTSDDEWIFAPTRQAAGESAEEIPLVAGGAPRDYDAVEAAKRIAQGKKSIWDDEPVSFVANISANTETPQRLLPFFDKSYRELKAIADGHMAKGTARGRKLAYQSFLRLSDNASDYMTREFRKAGIDADVDVGFGVFEGAFEPSMTITSTAPRSEFMAFKNKVIDFADIDFGQDSVIFHETIPADVVVKKYGVIKRGEGPGALSIGEAIEPAASIKFLSTKTGRSIKATREELNKITMIYKDINPYGGFTVSGDRRGVDIINLSAYNTDYLKFAKEVREFVKRLDAAGFRLSIERTNRRVGHFGKVGNRKKGKATYDDYRRYYDSTTGNPRPARYDLKDADKNRLANEHRRQHKAEVEFDKRAFPGDPPPRLPPQGGRTATGGEGYRPQAGRAVNILLNKYDDYQRELIQSVADNNPEKMAEARRGVMSDVQIRAEAEQIAHTELGLDLVSGWEKGQAWNAETLTAVRIALSEKSDDVIRLAEVVNAADSSENMLNFLSALQDQVAVQQVVTGITAEAGRALRSLRQMISGAVDPRELETILSTVGDRGNLRDIAKKISELKADPVKRNALARKTVEPKWYDKFFEIWINGLLSSPKTHIINELSNKLNMLLSPVETLGSAFTDNIAASLTGRKTERFYGEATEEIVGGLSGFTDGIEAFVRTIKTGVNPVEAAKYDYTRQGFGGMFGRIVRLPGTALEAADAMNMTMNYRAALSKLSYREARKEGLEGTALLDRVATLMATPPKAIEDAAIEQAKYRLFRGDPGEFANALMRLRQKAPVLRLVIPFLRTPANLLKYGLARSPVGFISAARTGLKAGKWTPEVSDEVARSVIGTTIGAALAIFVAQGKITGAVPKTAPERDRFYREGKLPFAIQVGGQWIQYQRIEPYNMVLSQISAMSELDSEDDLSEASWNVATTLGENLVSQSYMSGLADVLSMLNEPERYSRNWFQRMAASGVPFSSALRAAAQVIDPTYRRGEGITDRFQLGLPGLSQRVAPVLSAFGEEAQRPTGPATLFGLSPIQVSPERQSAVDAELERVGVEVGLTGDTIGGEELPQELRLQYQRLAGQETLRRLELLFSNPGYVRAPDLQKETLIRRAVSRSRELARNQIERMMRQATPVG